MPIGNLTSQIFANIYLNEFDQFVLHSLKPWRYVRYGDDCLLFSETRLAAEQLRLVATQFLKESLGLAISRKNDIIIPVWRGVNFLGVNIFPGGSRLSRRNWQRTKRRLSRSNASSYYGLLAEHGNYKRKKELSWLVSKLI